MSQIYDPEKSPPVAIEQVDTKADRDLAAATAALEHTYEGEHGTKRVLKPRVVSMIAIAGCIGTGLFLGSGAALVNGGPVGFFLGYLIMGCLVGMMMYSLGEMTCFAPNIGGFIEMGNRYIDPAYGAMMGLNYIFQVGIGVPAELSALASLVGFWDKSSKHAAAYITAFLLFALFSNVVGVRLYGEIEFFFAVLKFGTLIGLILFGLIADLGGVPPHREFIGGRHWRNEPWNDNFKGLGLPVNLSRFLGFWSVFTKAAFSYATTEGVAVLAGEAHNPRKTMRTAIRTVFYRIVGIYMLSVLVISLNVSQHSPDLLSAVALGGHDAASSPFVVICKQTGVRVLPHIINAVVVTSAASSTSENLYACSRTMVALARQRALPRVFLKTDKLGNPIVAVGAATAIGLLAYLSLSNGSNQVFLWLSNLGALSSLINWTSICICFLRFKKALAVQGIDRRKLPLRSWCQPYMAWVCIIFFSLVVIFSSFTAFLGGFKVVDFVAGYITLPFLLLFFLGYKILRKTKMVDLNEIDLSDGPAEALEGTRYDRYGDVQAAMFTQ
ncbi:putative amino-acid permease [Vanrija pseudolonga]|uniref:Purtative amino-acid permease n=1 Tax=Vanrija pseudolonga TaxID=143232 RepID=A0AAF1BLG7_9TREE|nr:purtative amino-acid permease [Vanrija pseudolonga]